MFTPQGLSQTWLMQRLTANSAALRRGRRSIPGQIYSLTTSTHGRNRRFDHTESAERAAAVLSAPSSWPHATALLWVLMPDHLHMLVDLSGAEALSRTVARIKALITRDMGAGCRVWQSAFHDHALRRDECLLTIGRYLLENPVRAKLVARHEDWPWRGGTLLKAVAETFAR